MGVKLISCWKEDGNEIQDSTVGFRISKQIISDSAATSLSVISRTVLNNKTMIPNSLLKLQLGFFQDFLKDCNDQSNVTISSNLLLIHHHTVNVHYSFSH